MDRHRFFFLFPIFILVLIPLHSFAQLSPSENRILFEIQQILEFPPSLEGWNNWTNFCYLPPSQSLQIVCSGNHITQLTIVGNKSSPSRSPQSARGKFAVSQQTLSEAFSIDTFFTVLTKLSSLNVLSLVSLGLWGSLPRKITRFQSLEVLNMSSNFLYGEIPAGIASLKNIRSIVLADNLLNGTVPDLSSLIALEEVDLSDNLLGPKFPSLGNKLVSIVLRNNSFLSGIPLEFKTFNQLQRLDISSNKLVGPIPSALFSLPSIQYLNLAMNRLSGALPRNVSCNHGLASVDLSHNLLTGRLPWCIGSNSSDLVVFYSWNCLASGSSKYQHPFSFCDNAALAVKPPTENQNSEPRSKLGLIIGIAVGTVVGGIAMVVVFLLIFMWAGVRTSADNKFEKSRTGKPFFRSSTVLLTDTRHVSHAMRMGAFGLPPYHEFTLEEIEEATNNFDPANLMGQGSKGQLYKGWLRDGSLVVVRCLKLKQRHSPQSLLQQMEVISKLRHRHLVGLLGHCIVTYQDHPNVSNTVFLVLEYVSKGTLRSHLTDWRKREILKWPQRVAITVGITRGIQFLHTGIAPGIFGNDLKIENILLDENLTAKISGYNLPLPVRVGSESASTGGEALDHHGSVKNSEKDDVYHLGVILLEVITGKQVKSEDDVNVLKLQLEESLMDIPSKLRGATDPSMRGTFAYESLKTTVEITLNCLSKEPSQRPSIDDVLWNLQYSVQVQDGWNGSGKLSGNLSGKLSGFLGGRLSGSFNTQ
ncbi:probable LRR receptor-like serine/threonine-protein kinase At1g14390 [Telopea speciosissima]|uniref:probable LRR receptor-like serine/threonine-protein kinase At1g14390 n=1 Tax=Telopea speciosissima TaxID=54955 RepID=UPI001CC44D2C|nr:probable LRR receptor-like serine/threonine-protein kinase At1g14390 [Telopea speciosissima]